MTSLKLWSARLLLVFATGSSCLMDVGDEQYHAQTLSVHLLSLLKALKAYLEQESATQFITFVII